MLFAVIAMLIAVGWYVASKWRGTNGETTVTTNELLSNFREMHSKGELSDEEFRTIKSRLAKELQAELNDSDKPG